MSLVSLNNGETIAADMVVSAVGVRPRIDLAQGIGIATNRGIVTNRLLETSAPNVYAMGDCAEVDGHVLVYVAPLMAAARALGKTLAGEPTEVSLPCHAGDNQDTGLPGGGCAPGARAQRASGSRGRWQQRQG